MDNRREGLYRIATSVVVMVTALVCLSYGLIFFNPQIALNPFKPGRPTLTLVAQREASSVPTLVLTPTASASRTVARPRVPSPTRTLSPHFYQPVLQDCSHAQGVAILGTVWVGTEPQGGVRVRVAGSPDGQGVLTQGTTGPQSDGSLTYRIVLKANGSFGPSPATWYVWTVDASGNPTSDPRFHVTTNNLPENDERACWSVNLDFAH